VIRQACPECQDGTLAGLLVRACSAHDGNIRADTIGIEYEANPSN
jgi:hypothetical protein